MLVYLRRSWSLELKITICLKVYYEVTNSLLSRPFNIRDILSPIIILRPASHLGYIPPVARCFTVTVGQTGLCVTPDRGNMEKYPQQQRQWLLVTRPGGWSTRRPFFLLPSPCDSTDTAATTSPVKSRPIDRAEKDARYGRRCTDRGELRTPPKRTSMATERQPT